MEGGGWVGCKWRGAEGWRCSEHSFISIGSITLSCDAETSIVERAMFLQDQVPII